ncbi:MAG: hypothetical protein DCF16_14775 [Alphaproteobacteria bacterium]|nr:MAG: hypothetical protein DCF16_14775 [Alphaproteobacteria bacterium]
MLGGKVVFTLDVRAELTPDEQALAERYKLWPEVVYSTEASTANAERAHAGNIAALGALIADKVLKKFFTIKDLVSGQHIECKDLSQVLAAEEQVRVACGNLKRYLEVATTFDGREVVVEIAAATA